MSHSFFLHRVEGQAILRMIQLKLGYNILLSGMFLTLCILFLGQYLLESSSSHYCMCYTVCTRRGKGNWPFKGWETYFQYILERNSLYKKLRTHQNGTKFGPLQNSGLLFFKNDFKEKEPTSESVWERQTGICWLKPTSLFSPRWNSY